MKHDLTQNNNYKNVIANDALQKAYDYWRTTLLIIVFNSKEMPINQNHCADAYITTKTYDQSKSMKE